MTEKFRRKFSNCSTPTVFICNTPMGGQLPTLEKIRVPTLEIPAMVCVRGLCRWLPHSLTCESVNVSVDL